MICASSSLGRAGQLGTVSPAKRGASSYPGVAMGLRVCACIACPAHPGSCPDLTQARHCPACGQQREQQRGSRQQRGYGRKHDAVRAKLVREHIPGTLCPKCTLPMWDTKGLDAGHSEDLRTNPDAVADQLEHRACNRGWRRGQ